MELQLRARLLGQSSIAAKVAGGTAVSWHERPATLGFPAVVLTKITPGREWTHDGPDGLDRVRVQFDFFGLDPVALFALRAAVQAEMEQARLQGSVGFHVGMLVTDFGADPETLADGTRVYRLVQEYEFFWESLS